jgi:Na+-driven multidrug efflux pump
MTISLYYHGFSVSVALAVASTSVIKMGNALGSKDAPRIRYQMRLGATNLLALHIIFLVIMFLSRRWYYGLITEDLAVTSSLMESGYVYAALITLISIQTYLSGGILFSFGKANLISILTFSCSCFVGLPVMFILIFCTEINVSAFFFALMAEQGVAIVVSCVLVSRLDLSEEIEKCAVRLERETSRYPQSESDELVISNPSYTDTQRQVTSS